MLTLQVEGLRSTDLHRFLRGRKEPSDHKDRKGLKGPKELKDRKEQVALKGARTPKAHRGLQAAPTAAEAVVVAVDQVAAADQKDQAGADNNINT